MKNDRIDLKEAAEPSGLFSAARRRSIRSRHELGLTQSCEVRRLIVQIQRKNKAKTKRFILPYRLINFATPSVAFDLHVNLKYNYSKWRRFCTSSARPKMVVTKPDTSKSGIREETGPNLVRALGMFSDSHTRTRINFELFAAQ